MARQQGQSLNGAPSVDHDSNIELTRASTSTYTSLDQVQQTFQSVSADHDQASSGSGFEDRKLYRVPGHINPDHAHFKPMELRLGLHTHSSRETTHGGMDSFKVQLVRKMVQKMVQDEDGGGQSSVAFDPMGSRSVQRERFVAELSQNTDVVAMYEAPLQDPMRMPPRP